MSAPEAAGAIFMVLRNVGEGWPSLYQWLGYIAFRIGTGASQLIGQNCHTWAKRLAIVTVDHYYVAIKLCCRTLGVVMDLSRHRSTICAVYKAFAPRWFQFRNPAIVCSENIRLPNFYQRT